MLSGKQRLCCQGNRGNVVKDTKVMFQGNRGNVVKKTEVVLS